MKTLAGMIVTAVLTYLLIRLGVILPHQNLDIASFCIIWAIVTTVVGLVLALLPLIFITIGAGASQPGCVGIGCLALIIVWLLSGLVVQDVMLRLLPNSYALNPQFTPWGVSMIYLLVGLLFVSPSTTSKKTK